MAQYNMNAYDADVYIPEFRGLMQYGDQMGEDLRYSPDCMNVETPGGVLQPVPNIRHVKLYYNGNLLGAAENFQVFYLHSVYTTVLPLIGATYKYIDPITGTETIPQPSMISPQDEIDSFLFVYGTAIYAATFSTSGDINSRMRGDLSCISEIDLTRINTGMNKSNWSACTYEEQIDISLPEQDPHWITYSILILSNANDGVWKWDGEGSMLRITAAPSKFVCVARYAERIWGIGSGQYCDRLFYSRAYSATNWSQNNNNPEDGGGEIREATFDNDKLTALVRFGDMLIAFSEQRAWKITGTDPSNFVIQEQYGNGTKYPRSIAVLGDRLIMLGERGLVTYDGNTVTPFLEEATYEIFRERITVPSATETVYFETGNTSPVAAVIGDKYVLALSNRLYHNRSDSESARYDYKGYKLLVYDGMTRSLTVADIPHVTSFCLQYPFIWASALNPSSKKSEIFPVRFDSWYLDSIESNAVRWVTPWITLGRKDIQKGGFDLYFSPELSPNAASGVAFKFSIQTEKKTKTKTYTVAPLTAEQKAAGRGYKQKRLHFGGGGRKFRLIIEVAAGNTVPWRLVGGIHIIAEIDKD